MNQAIFSSLNTLPSFGAYLVVSLLLTGIFVAAYIKVTPYKEFELIRQGNSAASISLSGSLIGFVVALASVIAHSVNLIDLTIWGGISLTVQLLAYVAVRRVIKEIDHGIQNGIISHGILLGAVSLSFGILNAACMTP
jgi:putative membrane protein